MTGDGPISHPVFARLYDRLNRSSEASLFPDHRRYLSAGLSGTVLEIGVGTGAMFPYYHEVARTEPDLELHGIEPDPHMRRQAVDRAGELDLAIALVEARAEALPFDDQVFDHVIAPLSLCSVARLEAGLEEIGRVLEPAGELRFFEHVRSPGLRGRVQGVASPYWRPLAGGCHIDRRTDRRIGERFDLQEYEVFDIGDIGTFPVKRFVRGRARPRDSDRARGG